MTIPKIIKESNSKGVTTYWTLKTVYDGVNNGIFYFPEKMQRKLKGVRANSDMTQEFFASIIVDCLHQLAETKKTEEKAFAISLPEGVSMGSIYTTQTFVFSNGFKDNEWGVIDGHHRIVYTDFIFSDQTKLDRDKLYLLRNVYHCNALSQFMDDLDIDQLSFNIIKKRCKPLYEAILNYTFAVDTIFTKSFPYKQSKYISYNTRVNMKTNEYDKGNYGETPFFNAIQDMIALLKSKKTSSFSIKTDLGVKLIDKNTKQKIVSLLPSSFDAATKALVRDIARTNQPLELDSLDEKIHWGKNEKLQIIMKKTYDRFYDLSTEQSNSLIYKLLMQRAKIIKFLPGEALMMDLRTPASLYTAILLCIPVLESESDEFEYDNKIYALPNKKTREDILKEQIRTIFLNSELSKDTKDSLIARNFKYYANGHQSYNKAAEFFELYLKTMEKAVKK